MGRLYARWWRVCGRVQGARRASLWVTRLVDLQSPLFLSPHHLRSDLWRPSPPVTLGSRGWELQSYSRTQGLSKGCHCPLMLNYLISVPHMKPRQWYESRPENGSLASEQSAEQGKNSFALLGPLLSYLVVGFLFLGNNQHFIVVCLLCLLFGYYSFPLSHHSLPGFYRYFCEFYFFNAPRLVWDRKNKYLYSAVCQFLCKILHIYPFI